MLSNKDIELKNANDPGDIGTIGKYRSVPTPYGSCCVVAPGHIAETDPISASGFRARAHAGNRISCADKPNTPSLSGLCMGGAPDPALTRHAMVSGTYGTWSPAVFEQIPLCGLMLFFRQLFCEYDTQHFTSLGGFDQFLVGLVQKRVPKCQRRIDG